MKGPDLLNNHLAVILRFRKEQRVVSEDIKQVLMHAECANSDCAFLCLLWNHNDEIEKFKNIGPIFGATSPHA